MLLFFFYLPTPLLAKKLVVAKQFTKFETQVNPSAEQKAFHSCVKTRL